MKAKFEGSITAIFIVSAVLYFLNTSKYCTLNPADFYQFWVVGNSLVSGPIDNIYSVESRRSMAQEYSKRIQKTGSARYITAAAHRSQAIEPGGSPFLYLVFHLIGTGDFDVDYEIYRVLSLSCMVLFTVVFLLFLSFPLHLLIFVLLGFFEWFYPFHSELFWSNVNLLQLGGVGLCVLILSKPYFQRKYELLGGVVGFLLAFKANLIFTPVLLVGTWFINKNHVKIIRFLLGLFLSMAVVVASSMIYFNSVSCWRDWLRGFENISAGYMGANFYAFLGFLVSPRTFWITGFLLTFLILAVCLAAARGRPLSIKDELEGRSEVSLLEAYMFALAPAVYIISGRMVHAHYFLLTLPLVFFLLRPLRHYETSTFLNIKVRHLLAGFAFVKISMFDLLPLAATSSYTIWGYYGTAILYGVSVYDAYHLRSKGMA